MDLGGSGKEQEGHSSRGRRKGIPYRLFSKKSMVKLNFILMSTFIRPNKKTEIIEALEV